PVPGQIQKIVIKHLHNKNMGKIKYGILGPISGKLGPVIGSTWMGIPYLRMAPKTTKEKKPRTESQLANEQKFKFGNQLFVPFHPYLEVGFQHLAVGKTAIAAAFSANYRKVITGKWPDITLHYDQVRISQGTLPGLEQLLV